MKFLPRLHNRSIFVPVAPSGGDHRVDRRSFEPRRFGRRDRVVAAPFPSFAVRRQRTVWYLLEISKGEGMFDFGITVTGILNYTRHRPTRSL